MAKIKPRQPAIRFPLPTISGVGTINAGGSGPGYTPYILRDFGTESGSVGASVNSATGPTSSVHHLDHVGTFQYSNDISGPFGASKCGKFIVDAGDSGFGSWLHLDPDLTRAQLLADGDMWMRAYTYFPSAFCAGYQLSSGEGGDGYGATKWWRFQHGEGTGTRATLQLAGFSNSSCASAASAPTLQRVSNEGFPNTTDDWWVPGEPVISRNTWHAIQMQIHWAAAAADSYMRFWLGTTYLGQVSAAASTVHGTNGLHAIVFGDYWNGNVHQDTAWYLGDIIITRETPDTVDSGGRPYISPSTQVADFS